MIFLIQGQINAITSCIILRECYKLFFKSKNERALGLILWLIYYEWQAISIFPVFNISWYVTLLINIVMIFLIALISYNGKTARKLRFSVVVSVVWILSEVIIGVFLFSLNVSSYIGEKTMVGEVLLKFVLFGVITFLYKLVGAKNNEWSMQVLYNIIFFMLSLGSMIIALDIFHATETWYFEKNTKVKLILMIIMLIINLSILKIYFEFSAKLKLARINDIYNQQLALYALYMKEKEKDFLKVQNARHDIKQHFIHLLTLLKSGKINRGIEYINQVVETDLATKMLIQSGNIAVDSIINFKAASAREKNIKCTFEVLVPARIGINDADFCVILGNMLDNAIEANEKVTGSKYIRLTIKWDRDNIFIRMLNAHNNQMRFAKSGRLLTTKQDKKKHGVGMISIQRAVEKYDGKLKCTYSHTEFVTEILIYNRGI